MSLSRSRTLYLLLWMALCVLAVRPVAPLERALDIGLVPTRWLGELARPIGWFQTRAAHAAEPGTVAREEAGHAGLERAVLASALPARRDLLAGSRAVHAEVVGRPDDELDTIRIRVEDPAAMQIGLPVVSGDFYVGLVSHLPDPDRSDVARDIVEVQLITAGEARVGAYVASDQRGESCRLVVGALAPRGDAVFLDVHNPENRSSTAGEVVVDEPRELAEGWAPLANGFVLGDLVRERVALPGHPLGQEILGVRPRLDYETGLYQVLVLCPPDSASSVGPAAESVLSDGHWLEARLLLRGEPSGWREGRKLAIGRRHGVIDGAALTTGTRLYGRVTRAGLYGSDVVALGDPGFSFAALAMLGPEGTPHVLGHLVGRGRDDEGRLRFEWNATLPLEGLRGREGVPAEVWTGSGEVGVPRGLYVGEAVLPRGPGPHVLHVVQPEGAREPAGLRVRRVPPEELVR